MSNLLADDEIQSLIDEEKRVSLKLSDPIPFKNKKGHKEQDISKKRNDGGEFKIIIRQNKSDPLNFSVILGYIPKNLNRLFRIIRYNGKGHQHTNKIEKNSFDDFYIHKATQRYQEFGFDEDAYAEVTDKYSDLQSALNSFVKDCNVIMPQDSQRSLFD